MGEVPGGTMARGERGMGGGTGKSDSLMLMVPSDCVGAAVRCEGGPIKP